MKRFYAIWLTVIVALLAWQPAGASNGDLLDQFRAQRIIIERYDGLVEISIIGAPEEAKALVKEVNQKRSAIYQKRASENSVPASEVAKIYAMEIFDNAPSGTAFRQPDGNLVYKP